MSILIWPTELPRPERNTWRAQFQDPRQRRPSDSGPPGYRRKFSSVAREIALSVQLTRNQKAVFDNFFEDDTGYGSELFTMPDPTTDGWFLNASDGSALVNENGTPLQMCGSWICKFGEQMPSETIEGVDFRISFSVMVMP